MLNLLHGKESILRKHCKSKVGGALPTLSGLNGEAVVIEYFYRSNGRTVIGPNRTAPARVCVTVAGLNITFSY